MNLEQLIQFAKSKALPSVKLKYSAGAPKKMFGSKLGGLAPWPKGSVYPTDGTGKKLNLLAQIDFSEMPELEGYPNSGILQVFIRNDDVYGIEFSNKETTQEDIIDRQDGCRVVFHESLSEEDCEYVDPENGKPEDSYMPFSCECSISFEPKQSILTPEDYHFDQLVGDLDDDVSDKMWEELDGTGSRLGGYAYFTQEDPRSYDCKDQTWDLLLQIDSESGPGYEIMWGDVGVAQFFIRPDDLKNKKFDKVWYNWDCS